MQLHQPDPDGQRTGTSAMLINAAPYVLSIVRIVVALLFFEHGTSKMFGWPSASNPEFLTLGWFSGALEFGGGALLTIGLFSRFAAFVMSGEMAFAYFISHAPVSFFPDPQPRRRRDPLLLHLSLSGRRRPGAVEPRRADPPPLVLNAACLPASQAGP